MQNKGERRLWPEHERKRTISFFILSSTGRIYLLAWRASGCTISMAKFSLCFLSSQGFSETKRYRIPLSNTSSSLQHPSQCQPRAFSQFLLSFFFFYQVQDLRYVTSCLIQAWRKNPGFIAMGYLLLSIAILSAFYHGSYA